jgi:hypothetical protein
MLLYGVSAVSERHGNLDGRSPGFGILGGRRLNYADGR